MTFKSFKNDVIKNIGPGMGLAIGAGLLTFIMGTALIGSPLAQIRNKINI